MRFGLFFLLFIGSLNGLQSQVVNIESKRIYEDSSGWSGSIGGKVAALQTRDLFFNVEFKPRIQYKNKKHYYLLISELNYSRGDVTYANAGMSHFRYAYRIKTSPWKWESYAQVQYNQLLFQKLRTIAGTGLRWKFIDRGRAKFFAGSSFFFEYEEIQPEIEFNADVRWSNYISWFAFNKENVSFTGATYYQPNVTDFKDFRLSAQYSLLFKFSKRTDFKFEFTNFYDSRPPISIRKWVFDTSAGFVVRLD